MRRVVVNTKKSNTLRHNLWFHSQQSFSDTNIFHVFGKAGHVPCPWPSQSDVIRMLLWPM